MTHTCRGRATLWPTDNKDQMKTVMCASHRLQRVGEKRGEATRRRKGDGVDV